MSQLNLNTIRCEALFASTLQRFENAEPDRVHAVIMAAVRDFGSRGCAARVAQEFGDHPDTAILRMRWARRVVGEFYGVERLAADLPAQSADSVAEVVTPAPVPRVVPGRVRLPG
jgi:hypothetical protein